MVKRKRTRLIWIGIGAVIILLIVGSLLFKPKPQPTYTTVDLKQGTLIQTVTEVGTVKANKELELNFAASGRVNRVLAKVGDTVKAGQVLMELDLSPLLLKEKEASSSLEVARANLNKLLAGATAQEIAIAEGQLSQAKTAYQAATEDLQKARESAAENISQATKKLADLESSDNSNITPAEQAVLSAQVNLDNAKSSTQQTIENSRYNLLVTSEARISTGNSALDYVIRLLNDDDLDNTFSIKNTIYKAKTKEAYDAAQVVRTKAVAALSAAKADSSEANLKTLTAATLEYLDSVFKAVNNSASALENTTTSSSLSQTTLDAYKTNTSANLTAVNTGISAVQAADYSFRNSILSANNSLASANDALATAQVALADAVKSARNALNSAKISGDGQIKQAQAKAVNAQESWGLAQKQLNKVRAAARSEDMDLAQAQVNQASANLDLIKKQEADSQITAPIDGQVSKINYEIGEQVATKAALAMLTDNNFEVEVDISETDISKVHLHDPVSLTFDAFGEARRFSGQVYFIEPASTVIQDVIYYKIKIQMSETPDKLADIKPGMTANVTITTNKKENVWLVPTRAIVDKNGEGKFIRLLSASQSVQEIPIQVGLSGDEGLSEISGQGLAAGQKVITFIKEAATAAAQ
jgi:HlyD family secretion protein